jgi:hypothetical protein
VEVCGTKENKEKYFPNHSDKLSPLYGRDDDPIYDKRVQSGMRKAFSLNEDAFRMPSYRQTKTNVTASQKRNKTGHVPIM